MDFKFIIVIIFTFSFFLSCNKSTTEPPEDPPGYQRDISWNSLAPSSWPVIGGNPQQNGRTTAIGPKSLNLKWAVDFQYGIYSGPVIGPDGTLFFGTDLSNRNSNCFYAVNPTDGSIKWTYRTDSASSYSNNGGIVISADSIIYFISLNHYLYALNYNGTFKWKSFYDSSGYSPTEITIDKTGNLYLADYSGFLHSYDKNTGNQLWKTKIGIAQMVRFTAITASGDQIIVSGSEGLTSVSLNGNINWTKPFIAASKIMIDCNDNIYFSANDGNSTYLYSMNKDQSIRMKVKLTFNPYRNPSSPTIDKWGNIYYQDLDSAGLYSIKSWDYNGNFRWKFPLLQGDWIEQPLICDAEGKLFFGSTNGYFYYILDKDGNLLNKMDLEKIYEVDFTGAISSDGTLYFGTHRGNISKKPKLFAFR